MPYARQSGRTTRQMQMAPKGSFYLWCTDDLMYPRQLARQLGRDDIRVLPILAARSPRHLYSHIHTATWSCRIHGRSVLDVMTITFDHACEWVMPKPRLDGQNLISVRVELEMMGIRVLTEQDLKDHEQQQQSPN